MRLAENVSQKPYTQINLSGLSLSRVGRATLARCCTGRDYGQSFQARALRRDPLHIPRPQDHVAKKPNYEFEKRKKEQERKAKQAAKLEQREEAARQRAEDIANGLVPAEE